jgi:hypothetical protein
MIEKSLVPPLRIVLIFPAMAFLSFSCLMGQSEKGIKPMCFPEIYVVPSIGVEDENVLNVVPGTKWVVFSDGEQNIPDPLKPDKTYSTLHLKFLDPLFVVDEKQAFVHIYQDQQFDALLNKFSPHAKDLGWIAKSQVLMWKHCLIDSISQQALQAIILSEAGTMQAEGDGSTNEGIQVFLDPDLKLKSNAKSQAKQIYTIFKMTNKSILLGRDRRITSDSLIKSSILGWVARNHCYILDNNYWLDPVATEIHHAEGTVQDSPSILIDEVHAVEFKKNRRINDVFVLWTAQENNVKSPLWLRFPVVSEKNGIAKVKVIEEDLRTGYAPIFFDGDDSPLFRKIALISQNQLAEIIYNMRRMSEALDKPDKRENLRKTFYNLLSSEYSGIAEKKIENLSFQEIFNLTLYFCRTDNGIMKLKMRKLQDPEVVTDQALDELHRIIKDKEKELNNIMNSGQEKHSFVSNDIRFYWVDLDLLF